MPANVQYIAYGIPRGNYSAYRHVIPKKSQQRVYGTIYVDLSKPQNRVLLRLIPSKDI